MKQLSPGIRFLLCFVTFLLCVVLFVTTLAGILVSNVVQILSSQENLESLLRQVMFVDMKHPVSTHSVPAGWSAQFGLVNILEVLIREIVTINSVICIGVFSFGLALLIGGIVAKCLVGSKYKKVAAAAEIEAKLVAEVPPTEVTFPTEEENIEETSETV